MGISKFFSDAAKLLFMGVGISDAGTIPRKIDLSGIAASAGNWRVLNCSASNVTFKGKDAVHFSAREGEGLAVYEGLNLATGKVDLAIAGVGQHVGLVIRAASEREYEVVQFDVDADGAAQRLRLTVRYGGQSTTVELSPRLIDEWLTARVVLARDFTAVFLSNSNTPSLKVSASAPYTSDGMVGLWIGDRSQAMVADLKYIQSRKRDF
jgi:hypothetical protein